MVRGLCSPALTRKRSAELGGVSVRHRNSDYGAQATGLLILAKGLNIATSPVREQKLIRSLTATQETPHAGIRNFVFELLRSDRFVQPA